MLSARRQPSLLAGTECGEEPDSSAVCGPRHLGSSLQPPMSAARTTSPRTIRSRLARGDGWVAAAPSPPMSRRRLVAWIAILSIFLPLVSATGALVALYATTSLPEIPPLAETTVLLDRNGNEVAELHAGVDRVLIPFSQMPESLREAVVAVEDADFYRHDGIDKM